MKKTFVWAESKIGPGQRITIGEEVARKVSWLVGSKGIQVWILTLEPGRYRLIPNSDLETKQELKEIIDRSTGAQSDNLETALDADSTEIAVLPSRLLPATLSPGSSWRLNLSNVPLLDANGKKIELLIVMLRYGYIELWSGLRFAQGQAIPIEELLR